MEMPISALRADLGSLTDEPQLIERAKHDRALFAVLYRRHYPAIAGYLFRRTGDTHATEDLVADVFLIALRKLPKYRHRGVPLRAWLFRIATHETNRWARRQRRTASIRESLATSAGETAPDRGIELSRTQQALLLLPPKQQAVIALHYLEGMPIEEVAEVVGCRVGTVKSRLSRGRDALRDKLTNRR